MIETSTAATLNSVENEMAQAIGCDESFDEDEKGFYQSIKKSLSLMVKEPRLQTIENILNYSRSFKN